MRVFIQLKWIHGHGLAWQRSIIYVSTRNYFVIVSHFYSILCETHRHTFQPTKQTKRALPRCVCVCVYWYVSTTIVQYLKCAYKYICISVVQKKAKTTKHTHKILHTMHLLPISDVVNNKVPTPLPHTPLYLGNEAQKIRHWCSKCIHPLQHHHPVFQAFIRILLPHLSQSRLYSLRLFTYLLIVLLPRR